MATDKQILQTLFSQIRDHIEPEIHEFKAACQICERPMLISSGLICWHCEVSCLTETARQMFDPEGLRVD